MSMMNAMPRDFRGLEKDDASEKIAGNKPGIVRMDNGGCYKPLKES